VRAARWSLLEWICLVVVIVACSAFLAVVVFGQDIDPNDTTTNITVDYDAPEDGAYDRDDWRHWIDADQDGQSTRDEVLQDEASGFGASREWLCPYTGHVFEDPSKLDVDHMIPLKYAHDHGGADWNPERKQEYANDLSHTDHLMAVSASANRQKGARGPAQWMPEVNKCEYALAWTGVARRWGLEIPDADAVRLLIAMGECFE
jgi:5-methylcytosine-specific restriction endonuclease McrA